MCALVAGVLLFPWGMALAQEGAEDPVAMARSLLREVTGRSVVPDDLWGGPVDPEESERLELALERVRSRAKERAADVLASLDPEDFVRLFEPDVAWSDEELEVLLAAILRRRKAPANAMDVLHRTMGDEQRLMRVRITAAVAAARLGKRSAVPALVFAARVSSELLAAVDVLLEVAGKEKGADRRRLKRFRDRWCGILEQVGTELRRQAKGEDLPKLEPGDWGALARWEARWDEAHGLRSRRGIVEDAYGSLIWIAKDASKETGLQGQTESILLEAVKEYARSRMAAVEMKALSADVVGAARRLERAGGVWRLFVNVGSLVKQYSYDSETKSWQCTKSYRLLEGALPFP